MSNADFYRQCRNLKRRIKMESRADPNAIDFAMRRDLQDKYYSLLRNEPTFAWEKGVLQSLWSLCVYDKIGYFKRGVSYFRASRDPAKLGEIVRSYGKFLEDSIRLFKKLMRHFMKKALVKYLRDDQIVDCLGYDEKYLNRNFKRERYDLMNCCLVMSYKTHIFLGDLERYKQLLKEDRSKMDWTKASRYYLCASQLMPNEGNSYNQLAVLAGYSQDSISAVYHYARSLSVASSSFQTARENLKILFDKNFVFFRSLFYESKYKTIDAFIESIRPIRLLFVAVIYCFQIVLNSNENVLMVEDIRSFRQISAAVISLSRKMLFSRFDSPADCNTGRESIENSIFEIFIAMLFLFADSYVKGKSKLTSQLLSSFLLVLDFVNAGLEASEGSSFLVIVSVLADFALTHEGFFKCLESSTRSGSSKMGKIKQEKFWERFLSLGSRIKNTKSIEKWISDGAQRMSQIVLPEEKELRGFYPLEQIYASNNFLTPFKVRRAQGCDLRRYRFSAEELGEYDESYETSKYFFKRSNKILRLIEKLDCVKFNEKQRKFIFIKRSELKVKKISKGKDLNPSERKVAWRKTDAEKRLSFRVEDTISKNLKSLSLSPAIDSSIQGEQAEFKNQNSETPPSRGSSEEFDDVDDVDDGNMDCIFEKESGKIDGAGDNNRENGSAPKAPGDSETTGLKKVVDENAFIRFGETEKVQQDLVSNGFSHEKALQQALKIKQTLEKMTVRDFMDIEKATLEFRPYFEAEKDACRNCNDISKELNAFKTEHLKTAMDCTEEIRKAKRVIMNSRDPDVKLRARIKLDYYRRVQEEMDQRARGLFSAERKARNEMDRAHFISFNERKKVYHPELNIHMIAHERFRKLAFVDVEDKKVGERGAARVAVSLGEDGRAMYHAFVKDHKYAYVPTAPKSTMVVEGLDATEDWREEFR